MKKLFVTCMAIALMATGALANVEKVQEHDNDFPGDEYQVGMAAPGATQILEDFEGGVPPANWTVVDNAGTGLVWNTNTFWGMTNNTNGSGLCAAFDSDANPGEFDTELVTESYDFCGATAAGLLAKLFYENYAALDFLEIDYSTDSGAAWTNLLTWNEDHGTEDVSLDMSQFDGYPSVTVRFRYYDPNTNDWDWDAQVDDFELTSDGTIVPGVGTCAGPGGDGGGGAVPATSTTGVIILAVLLMIGGSLFVVLRRRTA